MAENGFARVERDGRRAFADRLTENAPLGMAAGLEAFDHASDVPLEEGLDRERDLAAPLYDTRDCAEGFAARVEGRDPEFEGRERETRRPGGRQRRGTFL